MNWVFFAALIVASSAAKLDRNYLPPASASSAGGSPGSLLTPLVKSEPQSLPIGSFVNEHDGVVVDVAPVGTRASQSGLGGPRISYGSTDSKVGDAAFRGPPKISDNEAVLESNPDLSAFHQPSKPSRTSFQISRDSGAHITKYHNDITVDRYSYGFEADNGIKAEEKGVILNGVQAEGGFSYVGDDGKVYSVAYTADKNGYRPVGSHLPTPPPIPTEILKALEQNSRDEAAGLSEDGSYDAQKYNTGDYTKSDANGKYNDRQTIKFSIRPESSEVTSGTFINKNQGTFIKPNIVSAFEGTKDNTKLESSENSQNINGFGINFINRNNFDQGQMNLNAGIGTRNEFLQQKFQGSKSPNLVSSLINKDGSSSILPPKPLSQQDLQEPINSGLDNPRPSSYDTSFSTVVSDNVPSKLNEQIGQEFVMRSDSKEKKNQPMRFQESFKKPMQGLFQQNFGIKISESPLLAKPINGSISTISKLNDQNNSQNSFTTQAINNQMSHNLNNRFSTLQSSTGTDNSFGLDQITSTNDRITGTSTFFPATKPVLSTKQPERILTTPFEFFTTTNNAQSPTSFGINQEQNTGSNFAAFPGISSTSKFTTTPFTRQEIKTQTMPQFFSTNYNKLKVTNLPFSLSSQPSQDFNLQNQQYKPRESNLQTMSQFSSIRPNKINLSSSTQDPNPIKSTQFFEQSHGLDSSYFYNRPSKNFSTDSIRPDTNAQKFPTTLAGQFDSGFIDMGKLDTKFTEENKDFTSSTYSQGTSGFNRQTNLSTLAPISQTTISENKGAYHSKGITQASISPFPSSLNFKESGKNTFNPFPQNTQINSQSQFESNKETTTGILQSSVTDQNNLNENSNSQTQQYDNKIYEYNKPLQSFPSASGNVANKQLRPLGTQFSMKTPFHANKNRISDLKEQTSFEMQSSSMFGKQGENSDRNTIPFKFHPSTQQFNDKLTTSNIQNPTDVTETQNQDRGNTSQFQIYQYTKPLQSLTSAFPKEHFNKNENQESQLRKQFNKQSTTAFTGSYTETMDKFQKDAQLTTQFDQEEFERKTEMPEFSQTASTFGPSIYQYTKPVQSFLSTSQQEYGNSQLPQRETTLDVMSTNFGQQYSSAQQFGVPSFQNRFNSKQSTTSQLTQGNQPSVTQFINNLSTSFPNLAEQQQDNKFNSGNEENNGEIYNYKKPNQTFSSSEQITKPLDKGHNSQYNSELQNKKPEMLTTLTYQNQQNDVSMSTGSQVENSLNSQQRPQQNSQLGEIYEYSKPAQTLTTPVQNNFLVQNINQQVEQSFDQANSNPNIFSQNLSSDTATSQDEPMSSQLMVTETNFSFGDKSTKPDRTAVTQTPFTSGFNSKPAGSRPQFAFQSACCRGSQTQKHRESQFTHSTFQNTGSSDLKNNQNFEAQKLTTQGLSTGEDFGGPRKPPSFDEKGYHY